MINPCHKNAKILIQKVPVYLFGERKIKDITLLICDKCGKSIKKENIKGGD